MKQTLMLLLAAVATRPMFLGKKRKEPHKELPILYDDFVFLEPRCSIGRQIKLKLVLKLIEGPSVETILGSQYEIEEDDHKKVVDFVSLLKKFAARELIWLTERSHPEERLGTVKRNLQNELPRLCRDTSCSPSVRKMFQNLKIEATSKITQ